MIATGSIEDLRASLDAERKYSKRVGFVPTMGYLHDGHVSLIERAKRDNDVVVVSIFVNPLQFGPSDDFDRYPTDPERDHAICEKAGVDILFSPSVEQMYPGGAISTSVDPGPIANLSEGYYRPGHFAGVATVCVKLFSAVGPCRVYMGKKDYQQVVVLRQVTSDLSLPVEIVACETVREPDGLAMSSRNKYLSAEERRAAAVIHRALVAGAEAYASGEVDPGVIKRVVSSVIGQDASVTIQYVDVAGGNDLMPPVVISGKTVVSVAAFIGHTRLIDNIELENQVGTGQPA
ncbi:MAG: pantoate--beta-alanine ligase [Actinomycetota bacterium]|nr:pantoate--beta-alanine ligase [Actinomycetota bacterium]